jgi:hypothetical protein
MRDTSSARLGSSSCSRKASENQCSEGVSAPGKRGGHEGLTPALAAVCSLQHRASPSQATISQALGGHAYAGGRMLTVLRSPDFVALVDRVFPNGCGYTQRCQLPRRATRRHTARVPSLPAASGRPAPDTGASTVGTPLFRRPHLARKFRPFGMVDNQWLSRQRPVSAAVLRSRALVPIREANGRAMSVDEHGHDRFGEMVNTGDVFERGSIPRQAKVAVGGDRDLQL